MRLILAICARAVPAPLGAAASCLMSSAHCIAFLLRPREARPIHGPVGGVARPRAFSWSRGTKSAVSLRFSSSRH